MNERQVHGDDGDGSPLAPVLIESLAFTPVRRSIGGHFLYCMRHYTDFSGRATRAEYWTFALICSLVAGAIILVGIWGLVRDKVDEQESGHEPQACVAACTPGAGAHEVGCTALEHESPGEDALPAEATAWEEEDGMDEDGIQEEILDEETRASEGRLPEEVNLKEDGRYPDAAPEEEKQAVEAMTYLKAVGEVFSRYPLTLAAFLLYVLWGLATFIPILAVSWRRLHDINLSGAWFLASYTPFIGGLVWVVLTLIDSKPGANRFGPPTKYP